ncbi:MAG: hypothetical protein GY717_18760 [Rhodobacteraceae bacterium]|nr:hypothetical protein [Paracoccaceae bacterium]
MKIAAWNFVIAGGCFFLPGAVAGPGLADEAKLTCVFQTICSDTTPCEAAPGDAILDLLISDDSAEVTIEGETDTFDRIGPAGANPQRFLGTDIGRVEDMTVLLSLYDGRTAIMTMHGPRFDHPEALSAFGSCEAVAQ